MVHGRKRGAGVGEGMYQQGGFHVVGWCLGNTVRGWMVNSIFQIALWGVVYLTIIFFFAGAALGQIRFSCFILMHSIYTVDCVPYFVPCPPAALCRTQLVFFITLYLLALFVLASPPPRRPALYTVRLYGCARCWQSFLHVSFCCREKGRITIWGLVHIMVDGHATRSHYSNLCGR